MKIKFENAKRKLLNLALTLAGSVSLAVSTSLFIVPNRLVVGGLSGISIILNYVLSLGIDAWIAILSLSLLLFGLFALGGAFIAKTLLASIVYPLLVSVFSHCLLPYAPPFFLDALCGAVFGGFFTGLGCSLAFRGGGSTGGVDILAVAVSRVSHRITPSAVLFLVDFAVILIGFFIYKEPVSALLGVLSAGITALTVNKIFLGSAP